MLLYSLQVPTLNNQTIFIPPLIDHEDLSIDQYAVAALVPGQSTEILENIFARKYVVLIVQFLEN